MKLGQFIFKTDPDNRIIIIRLVVGLIFISEGIQKILFPGSLGTGRFAMIGFSNPSFWAYFTAAFEISCSLLVLFGLLIRPASMPLLIIMATAFITTKLPMLMQKGFWPFAHEYRTDFAITMLLIYLLISGSGNWSLDLKIFKRQKATGK